MDLTTYRRGTAGVGAVAVKIVPMIAAGRVQHPAAMAMTVIVDAVHRPGLDYPDSITPTRLARLDYSDPGERALAGDDRAGASTRGQS
ncbi:MAG TPA: hypothetical protein VIP98_20040 [Microlunatus sp.]